MTPPMITSNLFTLARFVLLLQNNRPGFFRPLFSFFVSLALLILAFWFIFVTASRELVEQEEDE